MDKAVLAGAMLIVASVIAAPVVAWSADALAQPEPQ
jgi:hypothetical protein